MSSLLRVDGMTCEHCGGRVVSALRSVPGVSAVQMDWRVGRCEIHHESTATAAELIKAVARASAGSRHKYSAKLLEDAGETIQNRGRGSLIRVLLAALPCLLLCGGAAITLPAIGAFLASKWIGVVPGLALGVVFGVGTWWLVKRRRNVCATCLNNGSEAPNP